MSRQLSEIDQQDSTDILLVRVRTVCLRPGISLKIKRELTMKANSLILLEAATRFELVNNGFADRCLSHLAMPPKF